MESQPRIAVIGLGYVGLPLAVSLSHKFPTVGFDINQSRVAELRAGTDRTLEVEDDRLKAAPLTVTTDLDAIRDCTFYIVTVPTPIDQAKRPDLTPVVKATQTVGKLLKKGDIVVYESTVYPGVNEEICGPILASVSGLRQGIDFKLGYSPERINPGDKLHTLERITKVVSGEDAETLDAVAHVYSAIIQAGIHRAATIKVAEAAKVIENTQRDLNIALMNELALIFDRMGIRTLDVLEAAGTKWNFLPFRPGLVGGHCIGVDPYYLTAKAEELGYNPQVILAGRRINDGMGAYVAQQTIKSLIQSKKNVSGAKVAVLGLTFKEDVPDLRNSRVPDILAELKTYGIEALVHDPMADPAEAMHEYGVTLCDEADLTGLDAVILAVAHAPYKAMDPTQLAEMVGGNGIVIDIKSLHRPESFLDGVRYWSL